MGGRLFGHQQPVKGAGAGRKALAAYALPLVCVSIALFAWFWARGSAEQEASSEDALGITEERVVRSLTQEEAVRTSSERFLEDLTASSGDDGAPAVVSWTLELDVPDLASQVLREYQDVGTASYVTGGYLDLKGRAWGAVLRDARGWVDIVLGATEDGTRSEARAVRLMPDGDFSTLEEGS